MESLRSQIWHENTALIIADERTTINTHQQPNVDRDVIKDYNLINIFTSLIKNVDSSIRHNLNRIVDTFKLAAALCSSICVVVVIASMSSNNLVQSFQNWLLILVRSSSRL
jgi:hypothetical protein